MSTHSRASLHSTRAPPIVDFMAGFSAVVGWSCTVHAPRHEQLVEGFTTARTIAHELARQLEQAAQHVH